MKPSPPASVRTDRAQSAIPIVFEEDLSENLLQACELAPQLCRGCSNYHIGTIARRAAREGLTDLEDRSEMIDHLIRLYRKAGQARPKQIDVVIAGAADTGLLAICANAAAAAGVEIMAKCRFNVLDRCPTPLALCERFGIRHRLSVKTLLFDVIADRPGPQADILIAHSLFRYLPQAKHVAVLKAMLDWLNPGGRMIFSVSVGWVSQPDSTGFGEMLRCGVASGKLVLPEPVERLLSRVSGGYDRRISNFDSFHAVRRLLEDAGAQTEFIEDMMRGRSRPQVRDAPKRTFAILANGL